MLLRWFENVRATALLHVLHAPCQVASAPGIPRLNRGLPFTRRCARCPTWRLISLSVERFVTHTIYCYSSGFVSGLRAVTELGHALDSCSKTSITNGLMAGAGPDRACMQRISVWLYMKCRKGEDRRHQSVALCLFIPEFWRSHHRSAWIYRVWHCLRLIPRRRWNT